MNIKSLLLGSAAALVAVSGARAADAVVMAEPEPMEYVRICDTYGTGYFYIPGTETCMKIGGYVRYDARFGELLGQDTDDIAVFGVDPDGAGPLVAPIVGFTGDGSGDSWNKLARFSLQVSTASETELGTLRTYTETRFNYSNGGNDVGDLDLFDGTGTLSDVDIADTGVSLNFAWIQLGGFRIGKDESLFTTFTGYAGNVISDDLVPYGPFDTNLMSYTFDAGNGFSAAVSAEEGDSTDEITDYAPHVVAGVKYVQGWGGISAVAGYDVENEEFAGKVRLDVTVNDAFALFVMGGYKTDDFDDDDDNDGDGSNYYGNWGGGAEDCLEDGDDDCDDDGFAVWAGASYVFTPQTTLNAQVSYDESDNFAAVANVSYEIVPGLKITPEIAYFDTEFGDDDDDNTGPFDGDSDAFGGVIRFQRSF